MDRKMEYMLAGIFCLIIAIVFAFINKKITIATIISVILFAVCMFKAFR